MLCPEAGDPVNYWDPEGMDTVPKVSDDKLGTPEYYLWRENEGRVFCKYRGLEVVYQAGISSLNSELFYLYLWVNHFFLECSSQFV